MPEPQIKGLPAGAELRPISGLPPGAELRPIGQQSATAPSIEDSAPSGSANLQHAMTGEGTYPMWDTAGHLKQVPYSQVPVERGQGYQFDTNPYRGDLTPAQAFTKDEAADPNRTGGTTTMFAPAGATWEGQPEPKSRQESIARLVESERKAPMLQRVMTGVAKGGATLAKPAVDAINLATGQNTPEETSQMMAPHSAAESVAKYATIAAPIVASGIAAPLATAGGLAGGTAGSMAGGALGHAMNLNPNQSEMLSDVGGLAGGIGGMKAAEPIASAFPTRAKAGEVFQSVMKDAKDAPVQLEKSGDALLRVRELADRGASMPQVANKLLRRVTDPEQGPLTYGEARDFASNLSRLSSGEVQKLTPVMQRQVGQLSHAFNEDVGNAASSVGRGEDYTQAMNDYRHASQLANLGKNLKKLAIPAAMGAGGYKLYHAFTDK